MVVERFNNYPWVPFAEEPGLSGGNAVLDIDTPYIVLLNCDLPPSIWQAAGAAAHVDRWFGACELAR